MALTVPDAGELELMQKMIKEALDTDEDYILHLYKAVSPAIDRDTVTGDFTECDFDGYTSKTLTRAGWSAPSTNGSNKASSSYAQQSWTCTGTGNTCVGYYVTGDTSGVCLWCEAFAVSRVLASGDVLNLTPSFTLASETNN